MVLLIPHTYGRLAKKIIQHSSEIMNSLHLAIRLDMMTVLGCARAVSSSK